MKAVTIWQPWAWLIVEGIKRVENRSWSLPGSYRGPLVIHAGKSRAGLHWTEDLTIRDLVPNLPARKDLPRGMIVGVVEVVRCLPVADYLRKYPDDPFACGPICWEFRNAMALSDPIPYIGARRIFDIPDRITRSLRAEIGPAIRRANRSSNHPAQIVRRTV